MLQTGEALILQVFLWSSGLIAGYEAMKASGWRIWVFGGVGALLILTGFAWGELKDISPPFTRWITDIAIGPQSWFLLIVIALVLLSVTGRAPRVEKTISVRAATHDDSDKNPNELAEIRSQIDDDLAVIRGQIDEVNANAALARRDIVTTMSSLALDARRDIDAGDKKIAGLEANLVKNNGKLHEIGQESPVVFQIIMEVLAHSLLFNGIPAGPELLPISDLTPDNIERQRTIASEYFEAVREALSGTQWEYSLRGIFQHGNDAADHFVRVIPVDERPAGIDPLDLRQYAISRIRCEGAGTFVHSARAEARSKYRGWLSLMKQLYEARKSQSL